MVAQAGQFSSLAPANRMATVGQINDDCDDALQALLHDPQTAGGLLAAVPADQAQTLLDQLLAAGEVAAIVGEITAGAARITLR